MKNKRTPYAVAVPTVNTGIFSFIRRTYQLLNDICDYSQTPEGSILADLDFLQQIDDDLNNTVSTLTSCIGQEICEAAQELIHTTKCDEPDNNPKFAGNERE